MPLEHLAAAMQSKPGDPIAKLVLIYLGDLPVGEDGQLRGDVDVDGFAIAAWCGTTTKEVQRALGVLADRGLISYAGRRLQLHLAL